MSEWDRIWGKKGNESVKHGKEGRKIGRKAWMTEVDRRKNRTNTDHRNRMAKKSNDIQWSLQLLIEWVWNGQTHKNETVVQVGASSHSSQRQQMKQQWSDCYALGRDGGMHEHTLGTTTFISAFTSFQLNERHDKFTHTHTHTHTLGLTCLVFSLKEYRRRRWRPLRLVQLPVGGAEGARVGGGSALTWVYCSPIQASHYSFHSQPQPPPLWCLSTLSTLYKVTVNTAGVRSESVTFVVETWVRYLKQNTWLRVTPLTTPRLVAGFSEHLVMKTFKFVQ